MAEVSNFNTTWLVQRFPAEVQHADDCKGRDVPNKPIVPNTDCASFANRLDPTLRLCSSQTAACSRGRRSRECFLDAPLPSLPLPIGKGDHNCRRLPSALAEQKVGWAHLLRYCLGNPSAVERASQELEPHVPLHPVNSHQGVDPLRNFGLPGQCSKCLDGGECLQRMLTELMHRIVA